ncbi:MAG: NUDIX hydrolase [bacterium]|nr:NUDIX hydrolase [bacterium]
MKKIPDHAKLVFKGILHDVYQWEQEMFDGTFATFEAIKKRNAVSIIAVVGDKIIINNEEQPNRPPFIAVPGGIAEDGYTVLENAQRELLEETGYESDDWTPWFVSDVLKSGKIEWDNHFFIARNCKKTREPELDPGERIETRLVTLEEFINIKNFESFRNKDLIPIFKKALSSEDEKGKLRELLKI